MKREEAPSATQALYEFGIQEGIRSLQHQEAELGRMRDRAIALVGLTATAAAFLVGAALHAHTRGLRFYIPMAVGTALYAGLLLKSWVLVKPVKKWSAKVSASVIIDDFATREPADAYKYLAGYYGNAQDANDKVLSPLRRSLRDALLFAGLTVIAFITLTWLVAS